MKQLRLIVADDHALILVGIRDLLRTRYEVVGEETNGKDLIDAALRLQPDMVVADITMPILNGIDAGREIKRRLPATKLVFLTMHFSTLYLRKALDAGASAYVLKSDAATELLNAIEIAAQGRMYVSAGFDTAVVDSVRRRGRTRGSSRPELTTKQKQILQLVAEGRQSKEIAAIMHVSVKTVEFHRSRLHAKLGENSVAGLTRLAIREGLIDVSEIR